MDFDGDGQLDLISGSYDPGELYLFRGLGNGEFAAREVILDKSGKPILRVPNQKDSVESFGSWLTLVDWDDDGDLDVLVGTFDGYMFLRRNEGTRPAPAFATENEWVKVGSKRLRVPGEAHAGPVIADWDGDGRWDILTGSADGGAYCYRNVGAPGQPKFESPLELVPKHEGIGYADLLDVNQQPRPGIRSQITVVDYDGDGKLDVLLGDFCTYLHVREDLAPDERRAFDTRQRRQKHVFQQLRDSKDNLLKRWKVEMKDVPKSDWETPDNQAKWRKMYEEMRDSPTYQQIYAEYEQLEKDLRKYVKTDASRAESPDTAHGYVWLFRRQ